MGRDYEFVFTGAARECGWEWEREWECWCGQEWESLGEWNRYGDWEPSVERQSSDHCDFSLERVIESQAELCGSTFCGFWDEADNAKYGAGS